MSDILDYIVNPKESDHFQPVHCLIQSRKKKAPHTVTMVTISTAATKGLSRVLNLQRARDAPQLTWSSLEPIPRMEERLLGRSSLEKFKTSILVYK